MNAMEKLRLALSKAGRKGGKMGAAQMTAEERTERARKAALATQKIRAEKRQKREGKQS